MALLYFILILSLVVFVHELGHLIVAKSFGVYCSEFAVGFGPKLFSYQGKETTYSLRAIPFGGFVAMAGEPNQSENFPEVAFERTIKGITPIKRILVMLAGIFMNLFLALVLFIGIFSITQTKVVLPKPIIAEVRENSPADLVGLKANDLIIKVKYHDGTTFSPATFNELVEKVAADPSAPVTYYIERAGSKLEFEVTPALDEASGRYLIGITALPPELVPLNFFTIITTGISETLLMIKLVALALINLFKGVGLNQLSGPLGIMQTTGEVMGQAAGIKETILLFFSLTASISINVALFNLLPIPAFDGGRVILTVAEIIKKGPLDKKWEERLILGSFFLMLMLFVFITWQDIIKIFFGGK